MYFLGARREVSTRWSVLPRAYPGLVDRRFPRRIFLRRTHHHAIADDIRASAPHMFFVGMPSPSRTSGASSTATGWRCR